MLELGTKSQDESKNLQIILNSKKENIRINETE